MFDRDTSIIAWRVVRVSTGEGQHHVITCWLGLALHCQVACCSGNACRVCVLVRKRYQLGPPLLEVCLIV
jgi:hypothetical protein